MVHARRHEDFRVARTGHARVHKDRQPPIEGVYPPRDGRTTRSRLKLIEQSSGIVGRLRFNGRAGSPSPQTIPRTTNGRQAREGGLDETPGPFGLFVNEMGKTVSLAAERNNGHQFSRGHNLFTNRGRDDKAAGRFNPITWPGQKRND